MASTGNRLEVFLRETYEPQIPEGPDVARKVNVYLANASRRLFEPLRGTMADGVLRINTLRNAETIAGLARERGIVVESSIF